MLDEHQKERYEKVMKETIGQLKKELLKTFSNPDEFESFVHITSKHPRFSENNILLIKNQMPQATLLYPPYLWESEAGDHRRIKENEVGIRILGVLKSDPSQMGLVVAYDLSQTYHAKGYELAKHIAKNVDRKESLEEINLALSDSFSVSIPFAIPKEEQVKNMIEQIVEEREVMSTLMPIERAVLKQSIIHALYLRYAKDDSNKDSLVETFKFWSSRLDRTQNDKVLMKTYKEIATLVNQEIRKVIYKVDKELNNCYLQKQFKKDLVEELNHHLGIKEIQEELQELLPEGTTLEYGG